MIDDLYLETLLSSLVLLQECVFHLIPSLSHNTDLGIPKIQFNYYSVEGRTFQGYLG